MWADVSRAVVAGFLAIWLAIIGLSMGRTIVKAKRLIPPRKVGRHEKKKGR